MPASYVKDKTTGKTYKLGSGGYYQEYGGTPTETAVEANGLGDYYGQLAKSETDPYYNTQTDITKQQTSADLAKTQDRLRALYTDQGMGNSSFYTGADTSAVNTSNLGLSGRLADIENARMGAYKTALGGYTSKQTAGEQYDAEQRRLEQERIYKEEQDRLAREQQQKQWDQENRLAELQYLIAKSNASSGGTKSLTSWQNEELKQQDLNQSIAGAVSAWASREKDRAKKGEAPGRESEEIYIPTIIAEANRLGLDADKAVSQFYNLRDSTFRR